jgi:hypothetical protein
MAYLVVLAVLRQGDNRMSFWSDASPFTKGVIVVGALGFLYLGVAYFANLVPFSHVEETQTRGIHQ